MESSRRSDHGGKRWEGGCSAPRDTRHHPHRHGPQGRSASWTSTRGSDRQNGSGIDGADLFHCGVLVALPGSRLDPPGRHAAGPGAECAKRTIRARECPWPSTQLMILAPCGIGGVLRRGRASRHNCTQCSEHPTARSVFACPGRPKPVRPYPALPRETPESSGPPISQDGSLTSRRFPFSSR